MSKISIRSSMAATLYLVGAVTLAASCAVTETERGPGDPEPLEPSTLVSDGSESVDGVIVLPRAASNGLSSQETGKGDEPGGPSIACYAYCADGYFYCPPNPLMECYWVCTRLCTIPDQPDCSDTCFDI